MTKLLVSRANVSGISKSAFRYYLILRVSIFSNIGIPCDLGSKYLFQQLNDKMKIINANLKDIFLIEVLISLYYKT